MSERLRGNRDFRLFLVIQTLSAVGDSFSLVAIPLLVLRSTGSVLQMGLVTGLTGVAYILTGVVAGVIVDRVRRRLLIMVCDLARFLLYLSIPVVWLFAAPVWLIYAVVPLAGVFSMLFQVSYVALVPAIVRGDQITSANGYLYGSFSVAGIAGPAVAGVIAAAYGPQAAIAVDAGSFAVSAVGILFVRARAPSEPVARRGGVRGELLAGARFLWRHPVLRPLTVLLSLLTFLTYGITDLVIFRIKHDLGHADTAVGYVLTAGTLGEVVASFAVSRVRRALGFGVSWVAAYALAGVAVTFIGLVRIVPLLGAVTAVLLLCTGMAGICSMSLRQEVTPDHLLGRVTSAFWTIHYALGPLGAAVVTAAAARFDVTAVCVVMGPVMLLIALSGIATGVWQARPEPASDVA